MKFIKFTPALFMFILWLHVLSSQQELKLIMNEPMRSDVFIAGISKALDNPWNHITALSLYFQKIDNDHANRYIWSSSDMLSREYWHVFQCKASLRTRIRVSDAANQPQQMKFYADLYAFIYN